jgi:hypothetical protein
MGELAKNMGRRIGASEKPLTRHLKPTIRPHRISQNRMNLRLKYPPTVENAAKFAADIVASTQRIKGVVLDYSVASLQAVDDILEQFREGGGKSGQMAETLFGFGCYVGEVFVRNAGGSWTLTAETKMAGMAGFPLVIQTGPVTFCNPIAKVFKRLDNGIEDNLPYFFQVFSRPAGTV